MLGDGLVGIGPCGPRCVQVQVILEDLQIDLLEPGLEKPGLPEPGQVVGGVGTAETLYSCILHIGNIGSEYRRRAGTETRGRGYHPRLPGAGERSHWSTAAPHTRRRRIGAVEGLARAVALSECDHCPSDALAQVQSTEGIARERHARHHP